MPHDDVLTQADRFVTAVNAGNWNEVYSLFATTIYHTETSTGMATSGAASALWFWQRLKRACPDWHGTIGWSVA
ncbi:MAG TPA: nuclear transport factor 2 family protein, partial [Roseiflexaceae bacterium]|nr:nuclear transport factor 2 family protein [Roseiflexaceae bacterium]